MKIERMKGMDEIIDIKNMIYTIRGQQVMLDSDLAMLYGYETKNFMFQLTRDEFENLRCKNSTSSWGGNRYLPFAFTEQGVYMLMTVLKGELAIRQSRQLIRMFKEMRHYIIENRSLLTSSEYEILSKRIDDNYTQIENLNFKVDTIMDNFIDEIKIKDFFCRWTKV